MLDQSFDQIVYLAEIEAQARSVTQEFGAQVVTVFSFDGAHFAAKLFFEFTAHVVCVELCDGLGDGLLADLFRAQSRADFIAAPAAQRRFFTRRRSGYRR